MLKCRDTDDVLKSISLNYSAFGYISRSKKVLASIRSLILSYPVRPESFADFFDWQERQTKFIVNSVRCYDFFGYQWRIPLWDDELFDYWRDIGYDYRYERSMFFMMDRDFLLVKELLHISFSDDAINSVETKRTSLNRLVPKQVKMLLYYLCY